MVFIILLFAVIVAIVAIIYGSVYTTRKVREYSAHINMPCNSQINFARKKDLNYKRPDLQASHPSAKTGCTLVTLAIVILALTSFVMAPTLYVKGLILCNLYGKKTKKGKNTRLVLVYGYSVQASCQPFFYDDNFKVRSTKISWNLLSSCVLMYLHSMILKVTSKSKLHRDLKQWHFVFRSSQSVVWWTAAAWSLRSRSFTFFYHVHDTRFYLFSDVMETCKSTQVPFSLITYR